MTSRPEAASMEGVTEPYRWLAGADSGAGPGAGGSALGGPAAAVPAVPAEAEVADAVAAADAAARAAGVTVHEISDIGGLHEVTQLFDEIWRPDPQNRPITTELLRALTKADNYVIGAFDGDTLVGACAAFFGPPSQATMHSHIAGVAPAVMRRSVGFAIKTHQRAWALRHGVTVISWTYDPLVSRNAYFNLVKLGAKPAEYLANFYGGMNDGINGTDDSDRLLVNWELASPSVAAACTGARGDARDVDVELARGAVVGLGRTPEGRPARETPEGGMPEGRPAGGLPETVLVAVPRDIETLRTTDPGSAKEWRAALREALGALMGGGWRVVGFDKAGWYVLSRAGGETS